MRRQCDSYGMLMASLLTRHDELPNYVDRRNNAYMNKLSEMVLYLRRG